VFGRGDKGNVRAMIRNIHRRTFLVPGDGSTRKSIVHVSTVADVVERALTSACAGQFVVADRVTPTIRELADEIADVVGRRRPLGVPRGVLVGMASVVERAAGLARVKTGIGPSLIEKATSDSLCDPSKVEAALGIDCHVDLREALRDEIAWLRETSAI
jgi:nucleoside-diphosphate-sugar epimerase